MSGEGCGPDRGAIALPEYDGPVTEPLAALGLIVELFTWIGFVLGALFLVLGVSRGAAGKMWVATDGVIVGNSDRYPRFRWFGSDGDLHESRATLAEAVERHEGESVTVYVHPRHPSRGRIDRPTTDGRVLRLLGWILLGIGLLSAIVGIALLFVEG